LKRHCVSSTTTARCGALGFLLRTSQIVDIAEAIWTLLDGTADTSRGFGEAHLTTREKEVVQLLAEGKLMKQVADMLHVSPRTVAFHKYGVMRKLGLRSSAELVRLAVSKGLVA
jgi:DNA-binding NarL/FixJ family response regulator